MKVAPRLFSKMVQAANYLCTLGFAPYDAQKAVYITASPVIKDGEADLLKSEREMVQKILDVREGEIRDTQRSRIDKYGTRCGKLKERADDSSSN